MRRVPSFRVVRVAALLFATFARLSLARAEVSEPASAQAPALRPARVRIALVGDADGLTALEARIESWFRPQLTELIVTREKALAANDVLSPADESLVGVWVVPRSATSVRLFFTVVAKPGSVPRYLVRDVNLDGGLDELGMEQITQMIYLSTSALWAGLVESPRSEVEEQLAPEPPAPSEPMAPLAPPAEEQPTPRAAPPSATSPALHVSLGFEYFARFAGNEGVTHGPAALLGLSVPLGSFSARGAVQAALLVPHEASTEGVAVDLQGASFALGATLLHPVLGKTFASAELAFGLDVINYAVSIPEDPTLVAQDSATEARPFLRLRVGFGYHVGPLGLSAGVGPVVQLLRTHYDVVEDGVRSELFAPWLVQPELFASAIW